MCIRDRLVIEALPDLHVDRRRVVSLAAAESGMSLAEVVEHAGRLRAKHLVLDDLSGRDVLSALTTVIARDPGHLVGVHAAGSNDAVQDLVLAVACGGTDKECSAHLVSKAANVVVGLAADSAHGSRVQGVYEITGSADGDVTYDLKH